MNTRKLFQQVWRVNALIIFSAGLLSIFVLIFAAYYILKETFREREARVVANTDNTKKMSESLSLGMAKEICCYPWLLVPLESDQKYDQAYYSKSAVAVRNYAFVTREGESRWIYPHNRFLIADADQLPFSPYERDKKPVQAVSFLVKKKDTNGDQRLTYSDFGVIMFTLPDGTGAKEVLTDVQRVISQTLKDQEILVIYEGKESYFSATVSLKDFSLIKREPILLPGNGS